MKFIHICLSFITLIHLNTALVCPIYLLHTVKSRQNYLIENCNQNCTFENIIDGSSVCIGVYSNSSGTIKIKQLGTIQADQQCFTFTQCILDIDSTGSQSYSCCCSTDNCTLNWHTVSTTTHHPILINKTIYHHIRIADEEQFSLRLFFILFTVSMIIILIMFALGLWKSIRNAYENDDNKSIVKLPSSSIENLFYSPQEINSGKNSIVYKTIWNNNIVALKVYQPGTISMWKNEVSLLKLIKHESIIQILTEGQYNSLPYLLLPFYECGTLESYLRTSNQKLSINQSLVLLRSLASAISYLHLGQNSTCMAIVHRDIKSSNILLDRNEFKPYLADFGVAIALPQALTQRDFVQIGTVRYMAPELLEGVIAHTREALYSVDIYAFALVMWEIVTQCDVYPTTAYSLPYEEYRNSTSDKNSFTNQIYDIVVGRQLRPSLIRESHAQQYPVILDEVCSLIEACWIADSDMRMNAQSLVFKLNTLEL